MPSLVEQLQRDAADPKVPVPTLLRRAKISAKKLGLKNVEAWVESELNGYTSDLPPYRILRGRLQAWNPYRGWIPMHGDAGIIIKLSQTSTAQSVDELQSILDHPSGGTLAVDLDPRQTQILNSMVQTPLPRYVVKIDRSALVGIMNSVRNAVLDWSLSLEQADIRGSEFSFSEEERHKAGESSVSIRIDSIGSFNGNLGTGNVARDVIVSHIDVEQARRIAGQLKPALLSAVFSDEERRAITPLVDQLTTVAAQSRPDQGQMRSLLQDLRNALSGAAGNIVASGFLAEIGKLFGG